MKKRAEIRDFEPYQMVDLSQLPVPPADPRMNPEKREEALAFLKGKWILDHKVYRLDRKLPTNVRPLKRRMG